MDEEIFDLGVEPEKPGIPNNLDMPTLGAFLCSGPTEPPGEEEKANQITDLNFTGKPGTASALYYSLVFQLPKWGWNVEKADEWIEVSPTHKEYYERTMATKQMLESTIKTGLTSAAQAVADFELMNHDLRKYKEILHYFAKKDEHSLKAMFIDQVDVHTDLPGQPVSMRSIAPRWPTIIADFIRLTDEDVEPDNIAKKLDISKAEAVILATKNKLYKQWKELFRKTAKERYEMLSSLVGSRKKSIKEYREWLKPYISRFKMTKLGGERMHVRAGTLKSFADVTGLAVFSNGIKISAWKPLKTVEFRRPAAEIKSGKFIINPYDDFIRENYILDPSKGLASIYPWLRNDRKYCSKCKSYYPISVIMCEKCGSTALLDKKVADEIVERDILPAWEKKERGLDPFELYYVFLDIDVLRLGSRIPVGELEDITFTMKNYTISQNVLLVKLLELRCRDIGLERYIDEMLGIKFEEREVGELVKEEFPELFPPKKISGLKTYVKGLRDTYKSYSDFFKKFKLPKFRGFMFVKPGPYETDFKERISKHYLTIAGVHFNIVTDFIKSRMGVE